MTGGLERRQAPPVPAELAVQYSRYQLRLPVVFQAEAAGADRTGVGWTCNLSECGLCVELNERLRPETRHALRLYTDRGGIDAQGRVIWVGRPGGIEHGIPHCVGFTTLSPEQRQALHGMLLPLSMVPHADVRLPLRIPIACQRKEHAGELPQGQTGNLSRTGMLVYLPQSLAPGTLLGISLPTAKGGHPSRGDGQLGGPAGEGPAGVADPARRAVHFPAVGRIAPSGAALGGDEVESGPARWPRPVAFGEGAKRKGNDRAQGEEARRLRGAGAPGVTSAPGAPGTEHRIRPAFGSLAPSPQPPPPPFPRPLYRPVPAGDGVPRQRRLAAQRGGNRTMATPADRRLVARHSVPMQLSGPRRVRLLDLSPEGGPH